MGNNPTSELEIQYTLEYKNGYVSTLQIIPFSMLELVVSQVLENTQIESIKIFPKD